MRRIFAVLFLGWMHTVCAGNMPHVIVLLQNWLLATAEIGFFTSTYPDSMTGSASLQCDNELYYTGDCLHLSWSRTSYWANSSSGSGSILFRHSSVRVVQRRQKNDWGDLQDRKVEPLNRLLMIGYFFTNKKKKQLHLDCKSVQYHFHQSNKEGSLLLFIC